MTLGVLRADARRLPLPDESVDLIVTSPPYFSLRDYRDGDTSLAGQIGAETTPAEYVATLLDCTREWARVLKPTGSLWINLGDKYAGGGQGGNAGGNLQSPHLNKVVAAGRIVPSGFRAKSLIGLPWRYALGCIDALGLILRAEVIWSKPNGLPESVTDRVRRSHEQLFHLVKQPRYYAAVDEIRELHAEPNGRSTYGRTRPPAPGGNRGLHVGRMTHAAHRDMGQHLLGKLPCSVWEVATQPLKVPAQLDMDHFAAFPPALVRRIILGWSPPDGLVVDPFGGTGTTALVASVHGRIGVSCDLSHDYGRLAQWRTTDPGERARALNVPKPPPVSNGQADLFEEGIA